MVEEKKTEIAIRQLYRRIREEFAKMPRHPLYRPTLLDGEVGTAILYTPARFRPLVLVVGNYASDFGDDEANHTILLATEPPTFNSYIDQSHRFGKALLNHFDLANRRDMLESCVGTNIWHFQCLNEAWLTSAPKVEHIKGFCEYKTREIIELLKPRVILAVGWGPFGELVTTPSKGKAMYSGRHRVYDKGLHGIIPVFGVPSVTSAHPHAPAEDIKAGFRMVIDEIARRQF